MKKNGFVFVETIVVTTVLTVTLILIYITFSNVLNNEKRRVTFNDTGYMFKTYFLEDFIVSLELDDYVNHYFKGDDAVVIRQFSCHDDAYLYKKSYNDPNKNTNEENADYLDKKKFCEKLVNPLVSGAKYVFISKYNVNEIKECTTDAGKVDCDNVGIKTALQNVDINFIHYLRTLSSSLKEDYNNYYRLIVEYEEQEIDHDSDPLPKSKTKGKCLSDFTDKDENNNAIKDSEGNPACLRVIKKYYYNNVLLIPKGKS